MFAAGADKLEELRKKREEFRQRRSQRKLGSAPAGAVPDASPRGSIAESPRQAKDAELASLNITSEVASEVRTGLLRVLLSPSLVLPIDSLALGRKLSRLYRGRSKLDLLPLLALGRAVDVFLWDFETHGLVETFSFKTMKHCTVTRVIVDKIAHAYPHLSLKSSMVLSSPSSVLLSPASAGGFGGSEVDTPGAKTLKRSHSCLADDPSLDDAKRVGAGPVKSSRTNSVEEQRQASPLAVSADSLEALLGSQSVRERELMAVGQELTELINAPTAKDQARLERFKSQAGPAVTHFCEFLTRSSCIEARKSSGAVDANAKPACDKVHYIRLIQAHTDEKLGDCSYLDACRHLRTCKFVHYEIDTKDLARYQQQYQQQVPGASTPQHQAQMPPQSGAAPQASLMVQPPELALLPSTHMASTANGLIAQYPPQWICCDVRFFDLSILGEFEVIMADPPWDIHMELPYGTLSDEEMLSLNIEAVSQNGVMFLWVTGRAMDLGRRCLEKWGYTPKGELIWIKTNQLQRLIRTGRTGHWLNHSKEHCLIGVKGDPPINRNIDCDVIVAEVRETSRKPDEVYGILERLSPGTRKLEIFGRPHNARPGWVTLGNQLQKSRIVDPDVLDKFKRLYPDAPRE